MSGYEVQGLSEDMFGVKLYGSSVINTCNYKQDDTKGYHFKYIKDLTPEERILYKLDTESKSA